MEFNQNDNSLNNNKNQENIPDELTLNYQNMDDIGKEKLRNIMEKFHDINDIVNSGG